MATRDSGLGDSINKSPPKPATDTTMTEAGNQTIAVGAASVTLKSQFKIPDYSGRAKHTTFQGTGGVRTELFSAADFVRQATTIKGAAKWADDITAEYVKLAFLPDSPVHDWYVNNMSEPWMSSWKTMSPELIKEFAAYVSVSDKVDILKGFKQRPGEASNHYYQRIFKGYRRFLEDLETEMTAGDYKNETAAEKALRHKIMKATTDFHLKSFYCVGLHSDLLADVTKSGSTSLEDILKTAKKSEQANTQSSKRHTIAYVSNDEAAGPTEAPAITEDLLVAALKRFQGKYSPGARGKGRGSGGAASAPKKQGGQTNVVCHYCNIKNHYANECKKRIRDRTTNGIWRQNIADPPSTKEEWFKATQRANQEVNTVTTEEEELYADFFSKN